MKLIKKISIIGYIYHSKQYNMDLWYTIEILLS